MQPVSWHSRLVWASLVDTTSCALFHGSVPGGWCVLIPPGEEIKASHLGPSQTSPWVSLPLAGSHLYSFHYSTTGHQDSAFLGPVSRSGEVLNLREGCMCVCMHTHTLLVKVMKMFFCSLFGVILFYFSQRYPWYWNRFLWIMYEPSCISVVGGEAGGAFFCLSLFVLVPVSYCLSDYNFVILLK